MGSSKPDPKVDALLERIPFACITPTRYHRSLLHTIGDRVRSSMNPLIRIFNRKAIRLLSCTAYSGTKFEPRLHPGVVTLTGYYFDLTGAEVKHRVCRSPWLTDACRHSLVIAMQVRTTATRSVSLCFRARPHLLAVMDLTLTAGLLQKMFLSEDDVEISHESARQDLDLVDIRFTLRPPKYLYSEYMHRLELLADLAPVFAEYFEICESTNQL